MRPDRADAGRATVGRNICARRARPACDACSVDRIDLYQLHAVDPARAAGRFDRRTRAPAGAKARSVTSASRTSRVDELARARRMVRRRVGAEPLQRRRPLARTTCCAVCERDGLAFIPWSPLVQSRGRCRRRRSGFAWNRGPSARAARCRRRPSPGCWRRSPAMLPIPGTSSVAHLEATIRAASLGCATDSSPRELAQFSLTHQPIGSRPASCRIKRSGLSTAD